MAQVRINVGKLLKTESQHILLHILLFTGLSCYSYATQKCQDTYPSGTTSLYDRKIGDALKAGEEYL